MASHRAEDRAKGLTGETDPQKIKANLDKIKRENEAAMDRIKSGK